MRLRENTVFLRLLTYEDLLDDGRYLGIIAAAEDFTSQSYDSFEDIAMRMRPIAIPSMDAPQVSAFLGQGYHLAARFILRHGKGAPSFEVNAMSHPYSGNHVTLLEWKLPAALLENPERRAAFMALMNKWIVETKPVWAHAHDADDNTIQNTESAMILRSGFGVDVDTVDVSTNPGREVSRAEFRYCANWLTYVGPAMMERLGSAVAPEAVLPFTPLADGRLYTLYEAPAEYDAPAAREHQTQLIDELGFEKLAEKERWRFGYWQRKH